METRSDCRVNKQLLKVKAVYFTFIAASGDLLPFIPVYMKQLGLSSSETGVLYGIMPFIAFLVQPVFGVIADKTHRHRLVLIICSIMTGICYCLLLLTPGKDQTGSRLTVQTSLQCGTQGSFLKDCEKIVNQGSINNTITGTCEYSLQSFYRQFANNMRDVACDLTCAMNSSSASNLEACFTNEVGTHQSDVCKPIWDHSSMPVLRFSINDIDILMENKSYNKENRTPDGIMCQHFDLKNVRYEYKHSSQFFCSDDVTMTCEVSCNVETNSACASQNEGFSKTFWIFFIIYLFCHIFFSPVVSLLDGISYEILGEKRGRWGMQRMWGSVGYVLFAITSTSIMDYLSESNQPVDYSISFYIYLSLCLLTGVVAGFLNFDESIQCHQVLRRVTHLLKFPQIVFFLIMTMTFGMMNIAIEGFLFWHLKDLGATQIMLGLVVVFSCVPEATMLFFSGKIIKKIGHMNCFYLCAIAYAIRFFCYSFLKNPWYALLIGPLHCLNFALFYAAASSYASLITPLGLSGTVQGLLAGTYFGLAKGVGSLITGRMFDPINSIGPVWTFRFFGFFALFILILYLTVQTVFFRNSKMPEHEQKDGVGEKSDHSLLEQKEDVQVNTEI